MNKRICFTAAMGMLVVSLFVTSLCSSQDNGFQFGSHDVGFRYYYLLDSTREWQPSPFDSTEIQSSSFRPLRIAIWYPAETDEEQFMKFENYINPDAPDEYFAKLNEVMSIYDMWSYNGMFDKNESAINKLLALSSNAILNAKERPGKYPLVLYCSGWFSRSPDNALLAEYLASHGYVVVTVPQLGTGSTIFDFKVTEERIMTQVQDQEFALNFALTLENIDSSRIASAGYSIGGIVQLWLCRKNPQIKALVALDGSFMFKEWEELSGNGPGNIRNDIPILSIYRGNEKLKENVSTVFFNSLSWANKVLIELPEATHGEFSDEAYLYSKVDFPWKHMEYISLEDATNCYQSVLITATAFLNAVFSTDFHGEDLLREMKSISDTLDLRYIE